MSCIDPIGDALFIDGGQLSTLRHEARHTCYTADPNAIPACNDTGVRIEVFAAAVTRIQMAGTAISGHDLLDLRVFGPVVEDGHLSSIQTSPIISNRQHIAAGSQVGEQAGGLKSAIVQFIAD